jgi:hypothetical protein
MYSKDIKEKIIRYKKLTFSWNDNANIFYNKNINNRTNATEIKKLSIHICYVWGNS